MTVPDQVENFSHQKQKLKLLHQFPSTKRLCMIAQINAM